MSQLLKSLQSPENLSIWPVLSLIIFFLVFVGLIWFLYAMDKKFIKDMSEMPLGNDGEVHDQNRNVENE